MMEPLSSSTSVVLSIYRLKVVFCFPYTFYIKYIYIALSSDRYCLHTKLLYNCPGQCRQCFGNRRDIIDGESLQEFFTWTEQELLACVRNFPRLLKRDNSVDWLIKRTAPNCDNVHHKILLYPGLVDQLWHEWCGGGRWSQIRSDWSQVREELARAPMRLILRLV